MAVSAHTTSSSRRHILKGAAAVSGLAALGLPAVQAIPKTFDPVAFLTDLRAAGVEVRANGTGYAIYTADCDDDAYMDVCWKWTDVRRADPYHVERVVDALLAEAA